jgi:hypothetical protein
VGKNVRWVRDETFGRALQCDAALSSVVDLGGVPGLGADGAFAVNFWMRQGATAGNGFEYVLSLADDEAAGADGQFDAWRPNSLHVYVPEAGHDAHGVVRFIYKDADDVCQGRLCQAYIDSDGAWMNNSPRDTPGHVDLEDGRWHMITLSTMPGGGSGFTVYMDGVLAAVSPPRLLLEGMLQSPDAGALGFGVDGGGPFTPQGRLKLCGRSDSHPERHYTGRLAQVELFDTFLTPDQVFAKFLGVVGETEGLSRALSLYMNQVLPPHGGGVPSTTADLYYGANGAPSGPGAAEGDSCVTDGRVFCAPGLICIPNADSLINLVDSEGLNGLCVKVPLAGLSEASLVPGLLPSGPDSSLPVPRAFFPLTGGSTSSWPFPFHEGSPGLFEPDAVFEEVLQCKPGASKGRVKIAETPFASKSGPFAVNLWVRKGAPAGNKKGRDQTFFSVGGGQGPGDVWSAELPNQIQLGVSPAGKLQVVVRDFNDKDIGEVLEVNGPGQGGGDSGQSAIWDHDETPPPEAEGFSFNDDAWHMVTLSTRPNRQRGIDVYLDGFLAFSENRKGTWTGKTVGGSPMFLPEDIHLCGRVDGARGTGFEGRLAHLMVFDEPLVPGQVAQMYATVRGKEELLDEVDRIRAERGEPELDVDPGNYDEDYDYPGADRYGGEYAEGGGEEQPPSWGNADDGGEEQPPSWGNADDGGEEQPPSWGNADDGGEGDDGGEPASPRKPGNRGEWQPGMPGGPSDAPRAPKPWEGSPHTSWGDDSPPAVSREWPSSSGGPIYAAPSPGGPFDSRDSAEALPGGLGSAIASTGGSSNTKAVVAGVVGGLAGVLVAGLAAGGVYMYMRKKRVTLPLTRAKMAESASKRYSQFDGEQPRSTDPLPVDVATPGSVSALTDASASSNPADV